MARSVQSLLLLWICILVPLVSCKTNVYGSYGKSTTLECSLTPVSAIEWYDWVFSLEADVPATIYKDGEVNDDEYHGGRFSVDSDTGALTISDLNIDDAGTYFCMTGEDQKEEFNLILAEMPQCQGQVKGLVEGDETPLKCDMAYSGDMAPKLEWIRVNEILGDAVDENKIGTASRTIKIIATGEMNKNEFICRAILGDMVEECSLEFEVEFKARKPIVDPEAEVYAPGATIACMSKGNPVPDVTVTMPDGEIHKGVGEAKVVIPAEWEAMSKFIHCTASNEVDGIASAQSLNYTFTVSSEVEPEGEGSKTTGSDEETTDNNNLAAIIAGLVIGAVVLVIIIVVIVCVKRKQSKRPKGSKPVPTKEEGIKDETKA